MQETPILLGFTAGELSPWLSSRFDLPQHRRAAAHIENFFVEAYGGVRRRVGCEFVSTTLHSESTRLVPFVFSYEDRMMLEFSPKVLRFYKEGVLLRDAQGELYQVETPWSDADELAVLRFSQVNDVIYVSCPSRALHVLRRYADTNWVCEPVVFDSYPRAEYAYRKNCLDVRIIPDEYGLVEVISDSDDLNFTSAMEGEERLLLDVPRVAKDYFVNKSLSISAFIFNPVLKNITMYPGSFFYMSDTTLNTKVFYCCIKTWTPSCYVDSDSPRDYPYHFHYGMPLMDEPIAVCGDWSLRTKGSWDACFELRKYYNAFDETYNQYFWNWLPVNRFFQDKHQEAQNWLISGTEKELCHYMIFCVSGSLLDFKSPLSFTTEATSMSVEMQIKTVIDANHAICKVRDVSSLMPLRFTTNKWSLGAFGPTHGHPRFAALHEGRLWLGGTDGQPTTLRASVVDDFSNFRLDSDADSSLNLMLASNDQNSLCWLSTRRGLLVGSSESEWLLESRDGTGISPTNAAFSRQSSVGSANMEALSVENRVYYVQRGGKKLREISYKIESDGYNSSDTSILAEHLFRSGVRVWAVQRGESMRVWVVMNDGSLAVLTSNPEQQVMAWQRVSFTGTKILQVVALPSVEKHDDELWFVVQRRVGDENVSSVLRMSGKDVYLDAWRDVVADEQGVAAPDLAGWEVCVYPKGAPEQKQTLLLDETGCAGGGVLTPAQEYCLGISYDSHLVTMPLESEISFNSVSQLGRVKLRLLDSHPNFDYRASNQDHWEHYDSQRDCLKFPYTGSVNLSNIPSPGVGQGFALRCSELGAFNLLAMTVERDYHGR